MLFQHHPFKNKTTAGLPAAVPSQYQVNYQNGFRLKMVLSYFYFFGLYVVVPTFLSLF
jgi:hypothetical protein